MSDSLLLVDAPRADFPPSDPAQRMSPATADLHDELLSKLNFALAIALRLRGTVAA